MTTINTNSGQNFPQIPIVPKTSENQSVETNTSDCLEVTQNKTNPPRRPKNWTVICQAETSSQLEDSFTKIVPEMNFDFKYVNFLFQFKSDKNADDETTTKCYEVSSGGGITKYESIQIQDDLDNLQDFISWGVENYPAQNYAIVLPKSEIMESFTEKSFYDEFASNPEIQAKLQGVNKSDKMTLELLEGFESFALVSSQYYLTCAQNTANLMASLAHNILGGLSEEKIELDDEAKNLESFFEKRGEGEEFKNSLELIVNEGSLTRDVAKKYGLSVSDLISLKHYTANGYRTVNKPLSAGNEQKIADVQPLIDSTVKALDKLPTYRGTVYRTAALSEEALEKHIPGANIDYKAFTSTSKYEGWKRYSFREANSYIVIESVSGGKDIGWAARHAQEDEVLFPPNTSFNVISHNKKSGMHYIYLHENPPEGSLPLDNKVSSIE